MKPKTKRTRSESGKLGRGVNAFVPRKVKKDDLQKRIDMVVKKAMKRESKTQHDVIRHINRPLNLRKGGSRIG